MIDDIQDMIIPQVVGLESREGGGGGGERGEGGEEEEASMTTKKIPDHPVITEGRRPLEFISS